MPNQEGYNRVIDEITQSENSNSETYDKALLTLSSVLLGITLTFTQNVVPLADANFLPLLILSWFFFALTIVLVVSSFIYVQCTYTKLKYAAKEYFLEDNKEANNVSESIARITRFLNVSAGVIFILAIFTFTSFVGLNVYETNVHSNSTLGTAQTQGSCK